MEIGFFSVSPSLCERNLVVRMETRCICQKKGLLKGISPHLAIKALTGPGPGPQRSRQRVVARSITAIGSRRRAAPFCGLSIMRRQ